LPAQWEHAAETLEKSIETDWIGTRLPNVLIDSFENYPREVIRRIPVVYIFFGKPRIDVAEVSRPFIAMEEPGVLDASPSCRVNSSLLGFDRRRLGVLEQGEGSDSYTPEARGIAELQGTAEAHEPLAKLAGAHAGSVVGYDDPSGRFDFREVQIDSICPSIERIQDRFA
jgi:hypothetical protein